MLHHYLELEEKKASIAARDAEVDALYMQLSIEDLRHVANTGEIKLAYGPCSPTDAGSSSWLDGFRGSPLFTRAIALEEQDLKHSAESMQRNAEEDQMRQEGYRMGEQIRLQKRLLEIEKAKAEVGAQSAAPPDAPAQGAGAMGDVPSQGIGKMAMSSGVAQQIQAAAPRGVKLQMKPSSAKLTANQIAKSTPAPTAVRVSSLGVEPDPFPKTAATVDGWARELARTDIGRMEQASMLEGAAKEAAAADFLGTALKGVGSFAKAHPGAAIGGGLGALHGLLHQGGGVGSAVLEGAGGAALGHGAQHFGGAAMAAHPEMANQVRAGADRLKAAIGGMIGRQTGPDPTKLASRYNALKNHGIAAGMGAAYGGLSGVIRGAAMEKDLKDGAKKHPDSKVRQFLANHPKATMGAAGAATGAGVMLGIFGNKKAVGKDITQLRLDAKKYLGRGKERDDIVNKAMDIMKTKKAEAEKEAGLMTSALGGAARMGMNAMTKMPAVAAGNVAGAGGMAGLAGKAMGWMKSNPMKAVGAGMNAASNFASARQSGQGVGSSLLSGAAGGATSLG